MIQIILHLLNGPLGSLLFVLVPCILMWLFVVWLTNDDNTVRPEISQKRKKQCYLNEELALSLKRDGRKF